jgi:hypothetical protein
MDPRIKIIYIRQLKGGAANLNGKGRTIITSRLSEWSDHHMYTNEEILKCLKMGIRWHAE